MSALSLQTLNRVAIYLDYYANIAEYAKNCENKALLQMHCNGKCQMVKKVKEQEKKDGQLPERKSVKNEVISSGSFFASVEHPVSGLTSTYNTFSRHQVVNMPRSFFHPPGA